MKKNDEEIFDINQKRFKIKKKDFKENLKKFYLIRNEKAFTRDDYDSWEVKLVVAILLLGIMEVGKKL